MKRLQRLLRDRRRRQRGSVLGALLIIVIFLSILIGALLTELTDAFQLSQDLVSKVKTEATVTSAAELAIHQLEGGPVPPVCAQDTSSNPSPPRAESWTLTLNGHPAAVNQSCSAIVPEVATSLGAGSSGVDGLHDTVTGNRYLVSAANGLWAYPFGSTTASWAISLPGGATAPPLTASDPNGSVDILAPAGNKVVVFNERSGSTPVLSCTLPTTGTVSASAAAGANFRGYAVIGDSGRLYVYDARAGGTCDWRASVSLTGNVAAAPLVFPGSVTSQGQTSSVSDEIFVLVTSGSSTSLQHWSYTESTTDCTGHGEGDCGGGRGGSVTTYNLTRTGSLALNGYNAVGYSLSASTAPLSLVVATASGRLDLARISVGSGPLYSMSPGSSIMLPIGSTASHAPFWCHCPGQDLIGVGGTNGFLYLFNNALNLAYSFDGQQPINTTPTADANGDWYFGANDGSVYDVEIPVSGTQMFKAAKFGPGGAIASSPIVGPCPAGPCLYFASSSNGSYFVRIGNTRISDLRACVSSAQGSTTCAANPRLWARVQVGPADVWGGSGVFVQGWSFYSP
jgi:hypothetical protein